MSIENHLEALKVKHFNLEKEIHLTGTRPAPDQTTLTQLKREKLKIKQQIERLEVETRH